MSFWDNCEHDWQPSAKSIAPPIGPGFSAKQLYLEGDDWLRLVQGTTTFIYTCAKCKDLKRVETNGTGDFVTGGKA